MKLISRCISDHTTAINTHFQTHTRPYHSTTTHLQTLTRQCHSHYSFSDNIRPYHSHDHSFLDAYQTIPQPLTLTSYTRPYHSHYHSPPDSAQTIPHPFSPTFRQITPQPLPLISRHVPDHITAISVIFYVHFMRIYAHKMASRIIRRIMRASESADVTSDLCT